MTASTAEATGPRLHDTAVGSGLVDAVTALHRAAGDDVLLCGPAGHAVAPADVVRDARRVLRSGRVEDRDHRAEQDLTPPPLAEVGLRALRLGAGSPVPPPVRAQVVWLRLGLSRRLLAACVDHVSARTVGGTALVHQQLVRAALGEAWAAHASVESGLADLDGADPEVVHDLHDLITSTDRDLLVLLGASGFAVDGAGPVAYVSELLADVYCGGAG